MPPFRFSQIGVLFLLFLSSGLWAQSTVGIRIGVINANQNIHIDDTKEELSRKLGADLAVVAEFPLFFFTLNPEIHWLQKGGKIEDLNGSFGDYSRTFNYLEIPLLVRLNFGSTLGFSFFAGPSFGYLLNGTDKDHDGSTTDIDLDFYKRTEFGAHMGGVISFGPVSVDIRYILGLTNIFEKASNIEILNSSLGAGVTLKL